MKKSNMKKETRGGARANSGKKRELKSETLIAVSTNVEKSVKENAVSNHGTLADAIRFAAKNKPTIQQ